MPTGVIWHPKMMNFWFNKVRAELHFWMDFLTGGTGKIRPGGVVAMKNGEVSYYYRDKAFGHVTCVKMIEDYVSEYLGVSSRE